MADVIDALVTFFESWKQTGIGTDGLPEYETVIMLRLAKPPLLQVERVASEADIADPQFRDAWLMFEKQRKARDITVKGYPLALWPVISPAEMQALAVRDIVTVEQLAPLADRRGDEVPAPIRELALRAKKLVAMQGKVGKFEEIINALTLERDAIASQLREANTTITAQAGMLSMLRDSKAA